MPRSTAGALGIAALTSMILAGALSASAPAGAGSTGAASFASGATLLPTPTAYVTNSQLDTVTVVRGHRPGATINGVGNGPTGIAVAPDQRTAYVADYGFFGQVSDTVTPIDLATGAADRPIKVGQGPLAIAVTPDGRTGLVTLQGDPQHPGHQVVAIDLATRSGSAPIPVGTNPESLAVAPDSAMAYVANLTSASVTPIDLATNPPRAETAILLPGTAPRAIAVAPNGRTAYVLDAEGAAIIPISLATRTVGGAISLVCHQQGDPGCTPTSIDITSDGTTAYVAAAGSGDVIELALPGLTVERVLAAGAYPDALGLSDGWLFVANGASNDLSVFHDSPLGRTVNRLSYPFGVAVTSPGAGPAGPSGTAVKLGGTGPVAHPTAGPPTIGEPVAPYWGLPAP